MKDDSKSRESYHHGNLPQTLIETAAELLSERGAEGFSMREVGRRAGVAVAAPSHHFGNAKGLLTAVATCAFERLPDEQSRAMQGFDSPADKVAALVRTYIGLSPRYPGYATVLFRWDLVDHDTPAYSAAAAASFDLLYRMVANAVPADTPEQEIQHTAKAIWAMAHGFVSLSLTDGEEADARLTFATHALLAGIPKG